MNSSECEKTVDLPVYDSVNELLEACNQFDIKSKESGDFQSKRIQLSAFIREFHEDCGTLNSDIEEAIEQLEDKSCLFLMTAHQPNLFAYSGVLRKATLNHVLSSKLKDANLTVVNFFGIADQDLTNDRWVKSSLLPDAERSNGTFELRANLPENIMLNRVRKPSEETLEKWKKDIENWVYRKIHSIKSLSKELGIEPDLRRDSCLDNFKSFWGIVEQAYENSECYSDFNAFIISRIINEIWGYSTLFCRFSDCQQIFKDEFDYLLRHFAEYSSAVEEATKLVSDTIGDGIPEQEYRLIPFWYHCDCGSKARLLADPQADSLTGRGTCLKCRKDYEIRLFSEGRSQISTILAKISARSLSMPLVFFSGLGVCCYVGGVGGLSYLKQAKFVAENLGGSFPLVVTWRPQDIYCGIGQYEAILTSRKLCGSFDFSEYSSCLVRLRERTVKIKNEIERLESQKKLLMKQPNKPKETIEDIKSLSVEQSRIRRETNFSMLVRNVVLLENVERVKHLHPSIIDYAVNIGLEKVNGQWIEFLSKEGKLTSDVCLQTGISEITDRP